MRRRCVVAAAAALAPAAASAFLSSPAPRLQSDGAQTGRLHASMHGTRGAARAQQARGALAMAMSQHTDLLPAKGPRARGSERVGVAGGKGLGEMLKVWVVGVIFCVSSALSMPSGATAVVASGHSHIDRPTGDTKHKSAAGKKLVLIGAGISSTLHQVFDNLDTHKTGSISKDALFSALVELKRRGFVSHELSDAELGTWLSKLVDKMVEEKSVALTAAAAAGDKEAAAAAASLTRHGPQIRFDTFVNAVEFAEKGVPFNRKAWAKKTRAEIMETPTHKYGHQWKDKLKQSTNVFAAFKKQILDILQISFMGLVIIFIPTYYIFPWYLFRFADGQHNFAKKSMLKKARIAGKRSEYFR